MEHKPKIAVIHPNSLCCLAMRTILTDIAPFMGMMGEVDIVAYNSLDEFCGDTPHSAILHFVASEVVTQNMDFFSPISRRCIILKDGNQPIPEGFRLIDMHQPERELLKSFLSIHNSAHAAHLSHQHSNKDNSNELSKREKEVLALIVKGYINKEIADKLNISTPTVIFHRRNLVEKIGSKSIGRLTIYAVMNGIVDFKEL